MAGDTDKKVHSGQRLKISAAQYNDFVNASRAFKEGQFDHQGEALTFFRSQTLVKIRNDSGAPLSQYGVLGIDAPAIDPSENPEEFATDFGLTGVTPAAEHAGKFVISLDACGESEFSERAVIAGVTPGLVFVGEGEEDFGFADVEVDSTEYLRAMASGGAEILWRAGGVGVQLALLRIGNSLPETATIPDTYVALVPAGGIPAMVGTVPSSAVCTIYQLVAGTLEPTGLTETVYNLSTTDADELTLVLVFMDEYGTWFVDKSAGGGSTSNVEIVKILSSTPNVYGYYDGMIQHWNATTELWEDVESVWVLDANA